MGIAFSLIVASWEFARRQPALHWVGFWLIFLPLYVINSIARLFPGGTDADLVPEELRMNVTIGLIFLSILLTLVAFWGDACVLVIGKRLLQTNVGRTRTSFRAVRKQGKGFILPLLLTDILRSAMTILWGLLFIIPGIIYSIRTTFAPVVVVCEGIAYRPALARSIEVVRGRTGLVFVTILILSLTLFLPIYVLSLFLENLWGLAAGRAGVLIDLILSGLHTVSIILNTLSLILLYGELRERAAEPVPSLV